MHEKNLKQVRIRFHVAFFFGSQVKYSMECPSVDRLQKIIKGKHKKNSREDSGSCL